MNTLVVCSGGLDSVSLAHVTARDGRLSRLVSFDYGQRHAKEVDFAARCAERLNVPHHVIDLRPVGAALTGSALTDDVDVPDGHYAEESMRITVVPNRNAIMLAVAFGVAAANGDTAVATAVHGGDHFIYPDCRPAFTQAFAAMQAAALDGYADVALETPFVTRTKADIVVAGAAAGTPFAETWSCYKGGAVHCGRCGTCVERREAFHLAGVADPTDYADPDFWVRAVGGGCALMYRIAKEFHFSASHQLDHLPADHPCARLHGHNYVVVVELAARDLDANGFVRDYRELSALKAYVDDHLDHRHLNDILDQPPTAEHIARHLYDWCAARWPETAAVRVSETPKTWAEWRP